jgi:DNA-binding transcriptional regulator YdaS (Cro superfamily)
MLLRDWLSDNDMKFGELADRLGVSRTAVHWWAAGRSRPSPSSIDAIAKLTRGQVTADDHQQARRIYERTAKQGPRA